MTAEIFLASFIGCAFALVFVVIVAYQVITWRITIKAKRLLGELNAAMLGDPNVRLWARQFGDFIREASPKPEAVRPPDDRPWTGGVA